MVIPLPLGNGIQPKLHELQWAREFFASGMQHGAVPGLIQTLASSRTTVTIQPIPIA
jgi:hypothetical protein